MVSIPDTVKVSSPHGLSSMYWDVPVLQHQHHQYCNITSYWLYFMLFYLFYIISYHITLHYIILFYTILYYILYYIYTWRDIWLSTNKKHHNRYAKSPSEVAFTWNIAGMCWKKTGRMQGWNDGNWKPFFIGIFLWDLMVSKNGNGNSYLPPEHFGHIGSHDLFTSMMYYTHY